MIIQPTRDHVPSRILLATNNEAKVLRFRELIRHILPSLTALTPEEIALPSADIEENGQTLLENASIKAQAYHGMTSFPILANDTGFFVERRRFHSRTKKKSTRGSKSIRSQPGRNRRSDTLLLERYRPKIRGANRCRLGRIICPAPSGWNASLRRIAS